MADEKKIRVLLVDDEKDFLAAQAKALERRGFEVSTSESCAGALAAVKRGKYDVAVLDVRLPDGDGHDLFIEIRKHHPAIQPIILTGNPDENKSFALSHKGLFEYLMKPCEVDVLARVITEAARAGQEEEKSPVKSVEPVKVLLVDDEEDFLRSLSRLLKRRGMIVHQANNGEAGLALADKEDIEVALLDLKMPGLSGIDVMKRLKEKRPGIEVIILTGHASVDTGIEGMAEGAADYLLKPQDPDVLARKIEFAAAKGRKRSGKARWWPFGKK